MFKVLRSGSFGADVSAWQTFLRGQGYRVDVDGQFGVQTVAATKRFQRECALVADGVVGAGTYAAAVSDGFAVVDEMPPVPDFTSIPPTHMPELFGRINWVAAPTSSNPEAIKVTGGWAGANLVVIEVPQLAFIQNPPKSTKMTVHKRVADRFLELWAAWETDGLLDRVDSFDGAAVLRLSRGSTTLLSNHAYGTAFDVNARWNMLGCQPTPLGELGSVLELVPVANKLGWWWRGHSQRVDAMHFEIGRM